MSRTNWRYVPGAGKCPELDAAARSARVAEVRERVVDRLGERPLVEHLRARHRAWRTRSELYGIERALKDAGASVDRIRGASTP